MRIFLGVLFLPIATVLIAEYVLRSNVLQAPKPIGPLFVRLLDPYVAYRAVFLQRWSLLAVAFAGTVLLTLLFARRLVSAWHNQIIARLAGTSLDTSLETLSRRRFDLKSALAATPAGSYFVGRDIRNKPVYLSESDLDTHGHIMGHTGSGKTQSVLLPLMFQDLLRGKGLLFMDAKGSTENVLTLKAMAAATHRHRELKIFSLGDPESSHTYNPAYLGTRGDPIRAAERVFSVLELTHEFYGKQAQKFLRNLFVLLAGTGKAFHLQDIRQCIVHPKVLRHAMAMSDERRARVELESQLKSLGNRAVEALSGLDVALAQYDHPLLNVYQPDIVLEDVLNERQVVYFNLPEGEYPVLAPAVGKMVVQHIRSLGAARQRDRKAWDQSPFAVCIDEFADFAEPHVVKGLRKLRDARIQFRLSHQSLSDLEEVSPVFAQQVKANTRWKIMLFENDPDHLEKVANSYGTHTSVKKTVRFALGPLFTFINTGEVSNREVETYNIHPNRLKSLAPRGQGFLLLPDGITAVNLEPFPNLEVEDYALPRQPNGDGLNLSDVVMSMEPEGREVPPYVPCPAAGG